MTRYLTVEELLDIAQRLPEDPACWDLGALEAAVARTRAHRMARDVYGSLTLKAAALLQVLVALEPLEQHNALFAWASARTFLAVNGVSVLCKTDDAIDLVLAAGRRELTVTDISAQLRTWTS
ncbi:fic family toxin-antitoxin system, toxin component [Streptomyces roseoverticillatus]|uniref:Fic family toxin-antitoxin system, toxin component n=1 Tax=Streptomyces roseoverticillatus TaxID=66429 RepID=A0ABV3J4U0_9ACTN